MSINPVATGDSTKLQPRYRGPYVVTEKIPGDTYRIESIKKQRKTNHPLTAHVSQLKIWRGSVIDDIVLENTEDFPESPALATSETDENLDCKYPETDSEVKEGSLFDDVSESDDPKLYEQQRGSQRIRKRPAYLANYVLIVRLNEPSKDSQSLNVGNTRYFILFC